MAIAGVPPYLFKIIQVPACNHNRKLTLFSELLEQDMLQKHDGKMRSEI
jgi:hypothetical protein